MNTVTDIKAKLALGEFIQEETYSIRGWLDLDVISLVAIEINGSIVQSNTHKNDAMLDISTKRSFQFIPPPFVVVAVDCGGASVFVVDMGSTDNGDSLLLLLYMLLGLTDVDFEINEFAKLVVLPNSLPCGL